MRVLTGVAVISILTVALTAGPREAVVTLLSGIVGGVVVIAFFEFVRHFRH
jgi:hypothetical protein